MLVLAACLAALATAVDACVGDDPTPRVPSEQDGGMERGIDGGGVDGTCATSESCGASVCGTLVGACGLELRCGTCTSGSSCVGAPPLGPFTCQAGPCDPGPSFCTNRCGKVTDGCGVLEDCKTCSQQFCVSARCACPTPDRHLHQYQRGNYHCYGITEAPNTCGTGDEGVKATIRSVQLEGSVPLYQCDRAPFGTLITLSATCEGLNRPPSQTLGYVLPPGSATVCGSQPLYRFVKSNDANEWYLGLTTTPPPSYVFQQELARVW